MNDIGRIEFYVTRQFCIGFDFYEFYKWWNGKFFCYDEMIDGFRGKFLNGGEFQGKIPKDRDALWRYAVNMEQTEWRYEPVLRKFIL